MSFRTGYLPPPFLICHSNPILVPVVEDLTAAGRWEWSQFSRSTM